MTDPYKALGEQLLAAASSRKASSRQASWKTRGHRRLRLAIVAALLALAGASIALAASGLLNGSAVKPRGPLNPRAFQGIPAPGGSRLLSLRVADPQGGPVWSMRIVHTTRGEVCVQVGRLHNGQLGELGIDGAFDNDRRFHPLPPEVLPSNGPTSSNVACVLAGQTFSGLLTGLDRSAATTPNQTAFSSSDQREVSFGLLGQHALSITYRTQHGPRTGPVTAGVGAYLIVRRASRPAATGGFSIAYGDLNRRHPSPWGAISAITYRFGKLLCSDGTDAEVAKPCPLATPPEASTIMPTRSLHRPLRLTLKVRHKLIYSAELEFTAPYAVRSAHQLYEVIEPSPSACGGNGGSGLPLERDIKRGEKIRVKLDSPLPFAQQCGRTQEIQVRFINPEGPSARSAHGSVIVGDATITEPRGTRPAPAHSG
ncbi:MAG TPA: hypothetical protein VID48_07645 [Solirubrobacteraceae bacterium]|jgi:hypothetical protein